jgi:CheY-like chemotaxis protein/HPt (histidine-containing phosphotransfer) domain-containing protein
MVTESVPDGAAALARLEEPGAPPFDLVMLDMKMPGLDGLEVARRIREHPSLTPLRLMLLTSVVAPEDTSGGVVDMVVSKPIRSDHLRQCVESLLRPAAEPVPVPVPSAGRPVSAGLGARILVAEDNAVNQDVARAYLEELGCHATLAGDGEVALGLVRAQQFDLVLMDCMMPRMDGFAATAAIRELEASHPDRPRVPIIALTASALQGERERCLAAGMDDFLPKPLPLNDLRAMLSHWLASTGSDPMRNGNEQGAPATPALPVLDLGTIEQLRRLTSGDGRTLLAKLIVVFTTDTVQRLDALRVAVERGNAAEVGLIAHTLKSASATLGALNLSARFADLETAATTRGPDEWARLEREIRTEYALALAALEATTAETLAHA